MKIDTYTILMFAFFAGLFIFASQPVWRGEAMVEDFRANCAEDNGVVIEEKMEFGINYHCDKKDKNGK